jgi:DNA-binding HxlR family transcriptional regulator
LGLKDGAYRCAIEATLDLIGGKWKALILCHLALGPARFSVLKRTFPDITQKMLTQQLRQLEDDGLINRQIYPEIPPKVEYSLTDPGKSLMVVIRVMNDWGKKHLESLSAPPLCCGAPNPDCEAVCHRPSTSDGG